MRSYCLSLRFSVYFRTGDKTLPDLSRKRSRQRLKKRREPHWMRMAKGAYLGFRCGPDTWVARHRDRDGNQHYEALSNATDYDEAKRLAEEWFHDMGSPAVRSARRGTVRTALETYLSYLREQGRDATARESEQRFELIVWSDPLAEIRLQDLVREDMREWRERLREGRQPRTINRYVRSIIAGLNRAYAEGHVGNPESWKLTPLVDDIEDGHETAVLLTPAQRRALIAAASPAAAAFFRSLDLTGGRPGELAKVVAGDFDAVNGTLTLRHKKGRPAKVRARAVILNAEGVSFFKEQACDKLPAAPLFLDGENRPWGRYAWAAEVKAAKRKHNATCQSRQRIPANASAYSFRHARISELLQVHGIDPVTVAQQTGTSLRMIEKYYFKFIAPALKEKLAAIEN